ncbi:hypothetical protein TOPH_08960 [Tolypocladium ophioglossoides CBS 100239]|uniref:HTH OST-type domain-containing protein n=1 Tax=Tolypocladium ophioglossoides (strain CBS 100239) TaxID=1163406 RepID=A0A0L0MX29_TOLOC|nr:hypothetical protein TOPH_08960 [Tolypocladium ophioglossoides CBS 100239]
MVCNSQTVKIAVLIDADNAQPSMARPVHAEIAKYGTPFVKRAYGDWTGTSLAGWKFQLLENSIQPIQQFAYTHGKNATDAAMVIDAMDLLYSNRFDGFCIVSSDSDFTRLASRIRESGLFVYGCGERKTPKPFVTACDKFIYVDNLSPQNGLINHSNDGVTHHAAPGEANIPEQVTNWMKAAVEACSNDDGWADLCNVGTIMMSRHPDFDSRTYGHRKISALVIATGVFDIARGSREGGNAATYVREKPQNHPVRGV